MVLGQTMVRSLGVAASQESAVELSLLVTELLGRFGVAGTVTVQANRATLLGSGPTVEIDVEAVLADWHEVDDDARRKRALDTARRLSNERRRAGGVSRAPGRSEMTRWIAPALAVAALGLAAAFWLGRSKSAEPFERPRRPAPSVDYDAYERERAERAERVCNATRSRIMRGAPVGPSDVEGWVVELSLLTSKDSADPMSHPAISTFVGSDGNGPRRITWSNAGPIAALDGPETGVTLTKADLPEAGTSLFKGLRVVLTGRYVGAYFDEQTRVTFVRFALAMSDALKADYTALYARCAAGRAHHLGSVFRGPTPGGAVASLLYFIGTFGDVPDVRRSLLSAAGEGEHDPVVAFRNITTATSALKKARVMAMVGAEGGMIAGTDDQPSTVSFPPRDPNRAARASHGIARELGIGENR
jgi:serine/threonine-protein kinase